MAHSRQYSSGVYASYLLVCMLAATTLLVWSVLLAHASSGTLTVAFLDVGQGDAIFVETPQGRQMLIDGGVGSTLLAALGESMSFDDRSIDVVLATHPDLDHIGGLPEVFARYTVAMYLESGVVDEGADYVALRTAVAQEEVQPIFVQRGMQLVLDSGVVLEVLFPEGDTGDMEANRASVVARLSYGDTSFMFTGDSPTSIESYLVGRYGDALETTVLKLGHHGSRTSTSEQWIGYVNPEYAVVSAGCDNSYGHPHHEVLERLERFGVEVLDTCTDGTIVFESDGVTIGVR